MKKIGPDAQLVLSKLLTFIVPPGMDVPERKSLAAAAGISAETLRHLLSRQSLHADTLIRLLLARGVSPKVLTNLPQTEAAKLSSGEAQWLEFGRELTDVEKQEFVALIKYIRAKWQLTAAD